METEFNFGSRSIDCLILKRDKIKNTILIIEALKLKKDYYLPQLALPMRNEEPIMMIKQTKVLCFCICL